MLRVPAGELRRVQRWDVSALVRAWWRGEHPNDGLLLQMQGADLLWFHAREASDAALRPQLDIRFADGSRRFVEAAADAALDCSTYKGLGKADQLQLRGDVPLALRFDLDPSRHPAPPVSAELILVRVNPAAGREVLLTAGRLVAPIGDRGVPRTDGIAGRYRADAGIARDPAVIFADDFNRGRPAEGWTVGMKAPQTAVTRDAGHGFEPLDGAALGVKIPGGKQLGVDLRFRFKERGGQEPEEVYFRYYLRLSDDWLRAIQGGKLPGLAGTYGAAGWGGRPWDAFKGWSWRGAYLAPLPSSHPASGQVMLGSYSYHSRTQLHGEVITWPGAELAGLLSPKRWICIEQFLRLNTPYRSDGVYKVWLDGRPALELDGLRLRDAADIRIEEVWLNVFHGGASAAPSDLHAFIDNVVVARSYIGPLGR